MEDKIKKITDLYNSIMEKPNIIYNIFKDFYGEELVDMQKYPTLDEFIESLSSFDEDKIVINPYSTCKFENIKILVRFPEVRVTNEHDKFIDIWELYAKVGINWRGICNGNFYLNRAEYDIFQFRNNYMHSHVSGIPKTNFEAFQAPCLGGGPIRDTLLHLSSKFDEDIWPLFCLELSKYVQVESLSGGPYKRLENLGSSTMSEGSNYWKMNITNFKSLGRMRTLSKENIKDFVKWFLNRKKLSFNFVNNSYGIATSYKDWIILLSNEFIEWYNQQFTEGKITFTYRELLQDYILKRGIINNNKLFYDISYNGININEVIGKKVCTFKGEDVLLKIRDVSENNDINFCNFINEFLAEYIYKCIIEVINYKYGNSNTKTETSGSNKTTIYI